MKKFYLLLVLGILAVSVGAQNLVLNGDFEAWVDATSPTSWTTVESVDQEATEIHGGTYSAKHNGGTSKLAQSITVEAGTTYTFTIWYKVVENDESDSRLYCVWRDGDGAGLYDDTQGEIRGPDGGYLDNNGGAWTEYTATVAAPATAVSLDFELRTYSGAVTYWDDFSLVAVADESAPVWGDDYPMVANLAETSFDIAAMLDETSTVYYVVMPSGGTAPSVAEVVAGTGPSGVPALVAGSFTATGETMENVSGMTKDVALSVFLVAEDDEDTPNRQDAVATFDVTPSIPREVLMSETFDSDLGGFHSVSVIGDDYDWYQSSGYAKMSSYSAHTAQEDWLISSGFNMDVASDEMISFNSYNNYGDATTTLTVYLSNDFTGDYTEVGIDAANWNDITASFTLSPGDSYDFFESGEYDISGDVGTGYIAFVFEFAGGDPPGSGTWEIDDVVVTGYTIQGSDASLSDLKVGETTIDGFESTTIAYVVDLPAGATDVPEVTVTTTDDNAAVDVTPATDLSGDVTARTTTVAVTAQDGETILTYAVLFNPIIEVTDLAAFRAVSDLDRIYTVTGEVVLTHKDSYGNKKYFEDASAAIEIYDAPDGNYEPGLISTVYEIGDGVIGLTGKVDEYYGMLEMVPTIDPGAANSTGNTVENQVLTVDEFNTNFKDYEAEFVKIVGVTFADAGTFEDGNDYNVTVGASTAIFRTNFYGVISGSIPKMADVQGIAIWHYDEAKVAPRLATDLMAYSSDATLSDLMVDGTSVDAFSAATLSYPVELPMGATAVPAVTYALNDDANATAIKTDATGLTGDEAARTTTVAVTAQDGTEVTYSVVFTVAETGVNLNTISTLSVYPIPATNVLFVEGLENSESLSIIDITGKVVQSEQVTNNKMKINISGLDTGIYIIRTDDSIQKFVKN